MEGFIIAIVHPQVTEVTEETERNEENGDTKITKRSYFRLLTHFRLLTYFNFVRSADSFVLSHVIRIEDIVLFAIVWYGAARWSTRRRPRGSNGSSDSRAVSGIERSDGTADVRPRRLQRQRAQINASDAGAGDEPSPIKTSSISLRTRAFLPASSFRKSGARRLTLLRQVRAAGFAITAVLGDAEFGAGRAERTKYYFVHLPPHTSVRALVALAHQR
jgi:hypothetical protein